MIMASEVGVLDIPAEDIVLKERLHPGRMFLVDTEQGRIVDDEEIKRELAAAASLRRVARRSTSVDIDDLPAAPHLPAPDHETVLRRQQAFGYTQEDLRILLAPMALNGEEPIGSMGTDTALAVLSDRPRLLYDYFKQLFAQVTNPPLDAIREELVTSMGSTIGPEGNLLEAAARGVPADQDRVPDPRTTIRSRSCATCRPARRSGRRRCRCCSTRTRTARASSRRWRSCAARPARRSPTATTS